MKDLENKIWEGTEEELKYKEGEIAFNARNVEIKGDLTARIPGRNEIKDVLYADVQYGTPMLVKVHGNLAKTPTGYKIKDGRVEMIGYREDKAQTGLSEEARIETRDPELRLETLNDKIILNQVQGTPVFYVNRGEIHYKI